MSSYNPCYATWIEEVEVRTCTVMFKITSRRPRREWFSNISMSQSNVRSWVEDLIVSRRLRQWYSASFSKPNLANKLGLVRNKARRRHCSYLPILRYAVQLHWLRTTLRFSHRMEHPDTIWRMDSHQQGSRLGSFCREINIESITLPGAYRHAPNIERIIQKRKYCPLCKWICPEWQKKERLLESGRISKNTQLEQVFCFLDANPSKEGVTNARVSLLEMNGLSWGKPKRRYFILWICLQWKVQRVVWGTS